ncbi:MAG: hypothetical protein RLY71_1371 [Pseudomonadota bacterium]|jgi:coenzyme F420 hydrogenase subunit beta
MRDINDVLKAGMCAGCGLCVRHPQDMQIDATGYLRPTRLIEQPAVVHACPGRRVTHGNQEAPYNVTWGPLLSVQTGHATDPEVRQQGSSGGVLTALLQYLLRSGKVDAVIQVGVSATDPIRNTTLIHSDPQAVLANAGSRYAPSAPLAVIHELLGNGKTYALVGKPCDVAALRTFLAEQPQHRKQFPWLLSFMCAGVPSEHGTEAVLKQMKVAREDLVAFRYRGDGWPGLTRATTRSGHASTMTYNESWGTVLNRHLQPRCKVCADGIGEAADIVCADAWHESENGYPSFQEQAGRSLILGRTVEGKQLIEEALASSMLHVEAYDIRGLEKVQPYQANRKRTALARALALRLTLSRAPQFIAYKLWPGARQAGLKLNAKTFLGTVMRRFRGRI